MTKTRKRIALLITTSFALLGLAGPVSSASAVVEWEVSFDPQVNTHIAPGAELTYFVTATNVGDTAAGTGAANRQQIEVTMPPGVTVTEFLGAPGGFGKDAWGATVGLPCSGVGTATLTCERTGNVFVNGTAPRLAVTGTLDAGASPGVLPPRHRRNRRWRLAGDVGWHNPLRSCRLRPDSL